MLQRSAVYNRVSFLNKGWTKNSIHRLLVKFGTVDRRPGSGRRNAHTDENVDTVELLLLSQEDKPQSHRTVRKISLRWGIHRSLVLRITDKDLHLKFCKRHVQQPTEAHSMHALFSVWSLRHDNVITSKPTWKLKNANSKVFWIFLPNVIEIDPYNCELLYRFKIGSIFWHSVHVQLDRQVHTGMVNSSNTPNCVFKTSFLFSHGWIILVKEPNH